MAIIKDTTQFIESLKTRNSNYTDPYQPMNLYNSLVQLSSGIYTEEERFIYELLQNADDAARNSKLKVRIDIDNNHFIFSHDGEPFDDIDVESICSVGDGGKSNDENKTGYKGIGFKSVFSHSSSVAIKTGDYFFKFSEADWNDHWQKNWGSKSEWQKDRTDKKKNPGVKMPWQIIPISIPIEKNGLGINYDSINDFNVSTILLDVKSEKMTQRVLNLLKDSQILLFLRCNDVILDVFISGNLTLSIKKLIGNESVGLYNNNTLKSEWIVTTKKVAIPGDVIEDISKDDKTPPKLKGATTCEISFAIQKEKNKLVSTDDALVYTYLPTSVSCGLPFVVNSNFITDSGRQQLQKESRWNLWIFNQMAVSYFEWIAELGKAGLLDKSFLSIIPDKLYFSELGSEFNKGYEKALNDIAFLPNKTGKLLKVNQAVCDKSDLTKIISPKLITDYLNQKYSTTFTSDSILSDLQHTKKLKNLGVCIFGLEELDEFFTSDIFKLNHSIDENFVLIRFLYNYVSNLKSTEEKYEWEEKLKNTSFIFDENEVLKTPGEIYFPSIQNTVEFEDDLHFVNNKVLSEILTIAKIKEWLIKLGVAEPTDIDFIEKSIIGDDDFVNEDNAIEIGHYLFNTYKNGLLKEDHLDKLKNLKILTQQNNILRAKDSFLSDYYEPELKLEKVYEKDIFVSEKYHSASGQIYEWKSFFNVIGVNSDILWTFQETEFDYKDEWKERFDNAFLEKIWETGIKYSWISYQGWSTEKSEYRFRPISITYKCFSFLQHTCDYEFSKLYFNRIFSKFSPEKIDVEYDISILGLTGFFVRSLAVSRLKAYDCPVNYFNWVIQNLAIFPSVTGELLLAKEIIVNSIENSKIAGPYAPILNIEVEISDSWMEVMPFQKHFNLKNYLSILTSISNDDGNLHENKPRILSIYKELANNFLSKKEEIKGWGKKNKLLSKNGEFLKITKLKFVNHTGFVSDDLVYADENNTEGIVKLFELFGVKVIHEFKPEILHPESNSSLKIRLQEILPYILLIAEKRNSISFSDLYATLSDKIDHLDFVSTEDIILSYESNGKLVRGNSVRSYLTEGALYYKGRWNNQMTLYSLIADISRFLEIKNVDNELRVLLLSDINDIQAFLSEELGIDVSLAVARTEFSKSVEKVNSYTTDEDEIDYLDGYHDYSDERSRINISNATKIQIFEKLKEKGFLVPENININYTIVTGIKNPKRKPVKLVVKGGRKGQLYFNPGEWIALTEQDSQLFVVTRGNIVRNIKISDLEEYNEIFLMRFNTRAFAVDTNLKAFAKFFRYLPYTHFIFNTPESTNDFLEEFGLNKRNRSANDLSADDKKLIY
jgi:hypothetical protein